MKKIKILMLTPYSTAVFADRFPSVEGYRESRATWSENLIKHLSKCQEIELYVITISHLVDHDYFFKEGGVHYYYLTPPISKGGWIFFYLFEVMKLRKFIKSIDPDIVHAQGTEYYYGLAAVFTKYPVLLSLHAAIGELLRLLPNRFNKAYLRTLMVQVINKIVIEKSKYVHTQTNYLKKYYAPILKKKIVYVLDLPVNDIYFSVNNNAVKNVIVFVGSSFRLKGMDTLLKIAAELNKRMDDFEVIFIGPYNAETKNRADRMIKEYCIGGKIKFLGQLGPEEIANQLSAAKVFVAPTRCDTYGMAAIEALCAGIPVISSNIMGVPYVVTDGEDGFLLAPNDVDSFVEKILLLFKNDSLRIRMGLKAKEISKKRWNSKYIAKEMLRNYEEIINKEISFQKKL